MPAVAHRDNPDEDTNPLPQPRRISIEAVVLLAIALALGGWLRFAHLGADEIEGDEAVSWRAASAPTIADVVRLHEQMNRGKLPLHTLVLHLWIQIFGQSETAMRAMSATLGTLAIALAWFVVYEAVRAPPLATLAPNGVKIDAALAASLSALITAASLMLIRYSREARMYPLMLAMVLAQVGLLMRAARVGGLANYAATAIFTALAIAANFVAALTVAAEFVWLAWIFYARASEERIATVWKLCATLIAGMVLLAPFAGGILLLRQGVQAGMLDWISPPTLLDPIETFESSSGAWVFAFLTVLAAWGCVSAWRRNRELVVFGLLWMWLPPILVLIGSYLFFPMNPPRYSLPSFVPFYMLASLALASIENVRARCAIAGALLIVMLARVNNYYSKPRDAQYREAAALALKVAPGEGRVGVATMVGSLSSTTYYFAKMDRHDLIGLPPVAPPATDLNRVAVVILPESLQAQDLARYRVLFPRLDGRFRQVEVRSR